MSSWGGWYFPRWRLRGSKPLPGLAEVLAALPEPIHPLSVVAFMGMSNSDLDGMSPADWLAAGGDPEAVVFEARSINQW